MEGIEIIPMQVSHLPEILAIERDVFPTPWTEGMFRQELSRAQVSRMYVALFEKHVVGYEIAWFVEDVAHLVNIAIAKQYQRKKIGTFLLERILKEAMEEGKQQVTLEVRESNEDAQAFYRSFSFEWIGIRGKYYSDNNEDAILMMLDLHKYARTNRGRDGADAG